MSLSSTLLRFAVQMKLWRHHSLFAVFLAAFVTLSLSASIVHASVMGVEMALAADKSDNMGKGCANCPDDSDGAAPCTDACVMTAFATLPAQLKISLIVAAERYTLLRALPRDGPDSHEPNPPKPFTIS